MEDYKKKYIQALERAKVVNPGTEDYNIVTSIFPELKESEDKRMIKSLKRLIKAYYDVNFPTLEGFEREDMIAWLEKQGEQKLLNNDKYQTVPVRILDRLYKSEKELERLKQIEQNTACIEKCIADIFEKVGLAKIVRELYNDNLTKALQDTMIELSKFISKSNSTWNENEQKPTINFEPKFKIGD